MWMTDGEIWELLRVIPAVSGWPVTNARGCARVWRRPARTYAIDAWVVRVGGRIEEHEPQRTLAPYYGQQPIPTHTLYLIPRSVLDD